MQLPTDPSGKSGRWERAAEHEIRGLASTVLRCAHFRLPLQKVQGENVFTNGRPGEGASGNLCRARRTQRRETLGSSDCRSDSMEAVLAK